MVMGYEFCIFFFYHFFSLKGHKRDNTCRFQHWRGGPSPRVQTRDRRSAGNTFFSKLSDGQCKISQEWSHRVSRLSLLFVATLNVPLLFKSTWRTVENLAYTCFHNLKPLWFTFITGTCCAKWCGFKPGWYLQWRDPIQTREWRSAGNAILWKLFQG